MLATLQSSHCLSQWARYQAPSLIVPSAAEGHINIFGPICSDDDADFWKWFYKTDYHTSDVAFKAALDKMTAELVTININSPGGNVWAGSAIRDAVQKALEAGRSFEANIVGLAASAAGIVAVAAPKIKIADMGAFMIHRASVGYDAWGYGNEDDLQIVINDFESRKQSLKVINEAQTQVFMAKMGKTREETQEMLRKETWFNATDAVEAGLANEIQQSGITLPEPKQETLPGAFQPTASGGIAVERPAHRFAAAAGLSREQLTEIMKNGGTPTDPPDPPKPPAQQQRPKVPTTPNNGVLSMNDAEVREVLGLSGSVEVTDAHRSQAWEKLVKENKDLKANNAKIARKAVFDKAKASIAAHLDRGAITPVQMTDALSRIMAADDPEEHLEFQEGIFEMLPDGDDDNNPGATARKAKGKGKAAEGLDGLSDDEKKKAEAFETRMKELEKEGKSVGEAQVEAIEELGHEAYEAYCYSAAEDY